MRSSGVYLFGFLMIAYTAIMLTFAIFMRRHGKRQDRMIREMRALSSEQRQENT